MVGVGPVVEGGPTGVPGTGSGVPGIEQRPANVAVPGMDGTGVPGIEWAIFKFTVGKFGGNAGKAPGTRSCCCKLGILIGNIIVGSGAGGTGGWRGSWHRAYAGIRREGHVQLQRLVAHAGYMQYSGRTNHFQSLERNCCWDIN